MSEPGKCSRLVLSRRTNESIVIGKDIIVTVIGVRGDKVRLGVEAPNEMAIRRLEIHEAIQRDESPKEGNAASNE
jgi:carbon storage regulator